MIEIKFTIGIGKDKNGKAIPEADATLFEARACKQVARVFGGYTSTRANGGWIDPGGNLIEERSLVITTVTDKPQSRIEYRILAEDFKAMFNQDCVMVTRKVIQMELI